MSHASLFILIDFCDVVVVFFIQFCNNFYQIFLKIRGYLIHLLYILLFSIMGVCCSKEGDYGSYRERDVGMYGRDYEDEIDARKGDYGATIRLRGSSGFVSMATQQGKKGVNQDAMTVWEDFIGEKGVIFCGVFDGHGPCGHKVARRIREILPSKLSSTHHWVRANGPSPSDVDGSHACLNDDDDDDNSPGYYCESKSYLDPDPDHHHECGEGYEGNPIFHTWRASFLRSFAEMDGDLSLDHSIDSFCSGTTAVTIVKQENHLIIGNLGDSRAVLCSRGDRGEVIPIQLTVDLKPSIHHEVKRIEFCGGRVFALDQEANVPRVWLPDEHSPGLAMTRAFGDFCLKDYGLISIPQLFYRNLTEHDEFIILATDGVWDVLTNLEAVKIVASASRRSMAAKLLVVHAVRAWRSRYPTSRADDCAVVCLFFKPPPRTKSCSEFSHITPDSLSHLNSSVSPYTRSLGSDEGFDNLTSSKEKVDETEEWSEGESRVDSALSIYRYTRARSRKRSTTFKETI